MQSQPNVTPAPATAPRPAGPLAEPDAAEDGFQPLDAEAARQWRARQAPLSIARVVAAQAAAGVLAVAAVGLVTRGDGPALRSAAWGAAAAWLPAAMFARHMARRLRRPPQPASALVALMAGEGIKIALTIALLIAAPKVLAQVNWLALLAAFVVTIKSAWAALWSMSAARRSTRD